MEMCEQLKRKPKRGFSKTWLSDDRFKSWIQKVPNDDNLFHCVMCNKDFSCKTNVLRHADSAYHKNNVKKNTSLNNDASSNKIKCRKNQFRQQWLDIKQFKPWLREAHNIHSFFCLFCEKTMIGGLWNIYNHAESKGHIRMSEKNAKIKKNENNMTENDESLLMFEERKKSAEIRYAALIADKNISYKTATDILYFFQQVGKDFNLLKSMTMNRTKCKNIISKMLCPVETSSVVKKARVKEKKESISNMDVNTKHLSLMSTDNLNTHCPKKSNLNLHAADVNNIADPSTSTQ